MLMVLLLYTDVLFLFACNFLQLFVLSVWKEHAESQSQILLPSGIDNPFTRQSVRAFSAVTLVSENCSHIVV
jgi:glucose-6-phosphate-specific signal transduction histidine kinase